MLARLSAAIIAAIAWIGIGIHFEALISSGSSTPSAIWALVSYFTILANLLIALVFTVIALTRNAAERPKLIAGTALGIMLVGIVYALLLSGLTELSGGSAVANVLLHQATPVLVPLFWLAFVPKGRLGWTDPFIWAIYPLAYLVYALVRARIEGRYAYPFIDVGANGWVTVILTCAVIAIGFIIAGWIVVAIDRALGARGNG